MRETVGTTSLFKAVLAFTLLFSAFLAIAIVYNKVYKLKNETLSILEKYEGTSDKALSLINNYLRNSGYDAKGSCENGEYGMSSLESTDLEIVTSNRKKYYYCLDYHCKNGNCQTTNNNKIFYHVKMFFKFNLPFFGEIFTFEIKGETKGIMLYSNWQKMI